MPCLLWHTRALPAKPELRHSQVNELDLKLEAAEAKNALVASTADKGVADKRSAADKGSAASTEPMSAGRAATHGGGGKPHDVASRGSAEALSSVQ